MKVKAVNCGLANYYPREHLIEYNKKVSPALLFGLLKHEYEHVRERDVTGFWTDLKFGFNMPVQWKITKFMLTHPSSWTQFAPFDFRKGHVEVNFINTILCLVLLFAVGLKLIII